MKVGIITFHFPFNCGAALQCYALQTKLSELGNEVQIINYRPWYHQNRYSAYKNPFYVANKMLHQPARNVLTRTYHGVKGFVWTVRSWKNAKAVRPREQKFRAFQKAHLNETRVYRTLRALRSAPPKCDLYLAGSDQLWNGKLTNGKLDPAYFLDFGKDTTRRATYAIGAHFADAPEAIHTLRPLLKRLDGVSLREERWLSTVMRASNGEQPFHIDIDPTLLLSPDAYEPILPKEALADGPFILTYTMPGEAQPVVYRAAKALSEETGLRIIDACGNPTQGNMRIADQRTCSPGEFLWYVLHADYVVTNSFHGTVFSVLYHKRFMTVLHRETGNRVSELLDKLGLESHYTNTYADVADEIKKPVDWAAADARLETLRAESVRYLNYCTGREAAPAFVERQGMPVEPEPEPEPEKAEEPVKVKHVPQRRGSFMYTDDKNAQIVLALLKKYNVRKIVVSPGTTNVPISRAVQQDRFFEVYSAVDERGAAYFACGLAFSSGEPVALSCTGATASRDYIPGMTEAFYRNLPVIAITSQHHTSRPSDLLPQMTDRTVSQNDVKRFAAILPRIKDDEDYAACVQLVNEALYTATRPGGGPVHINLPVGDLYAFNTPELPDVQKIDVYDAENFPKAELAKELKDQKVALFIGAHNPFTPETTEAISAFVTALDAAVFCDHTANYTGANRVLSAVAGDLAELKDLPDLIIDMGSVSGDYSASRLFKGRRVWRISEDRVYHNRHGAERVEKQFFCSERFFFGQMKDVNGDAIYYSAIRESTARAELPNLPLSNLYAASKLSERIPNGSFLHLGILNSLRSMNYFALDPSVRVTSNVGGFGIDGALSTALGQSKADPKRLSFCVLGDLAFFYDMNALGNRHVGRNLRILLINNERGVEFRLNNGLERQWGAETDDLIAAKGHFGSAKAWAESMGFAYLTASDKKSFDAQIDAFCDPNQDRFKKPVVFEVFTDVADEQSALKNLRSFNRTKR